MNPKSLSLLEIKMAHPNWYRATDFHWLDGNLKSKGKIDFWATAFAECDYNPANGQYQLFNASRSGEGVSQRFTIECVKDNSAGWFVPGFQYEAFEKGGKLVVVMDDGLEILAEDAEFKKL